MSEASFDAAFAAARRVEGWLTEAQAQRLWDRARNAPAGGLVVEIGSFRGRSAIVMASALAAGARLVAIDPHAGGEADHQQFLANLRAAGVADRVEHVRLMSSEALDSVGGQIDVLYVDGAHRFGPARDDLVRWGARVREGGTMLVHDSFSAVGLTLALLRALTFGDRWRYVGRSGSLAEYRREQLAPAPRVASALRQLAQLPWFARNVLLKLAIVARLGVLQRLLGSRDGGWPY